MPPAPPPSGDPAPAPDPARVSDPEVELDADPDADPDAGPEAGRVAASPGIAGPEPRDEAPRPADPPADPTAGPPADPVSERRQIDPAIAAILREEAEREARLRRGDPAPDLVQSQGEMPLDAGPSTARARREAELAAAEDAFDTDAIATAVAQAAAASRRELLPDIEEINSTLRATGDRSEEERDATDADTLGARGRRRQSRRGFVLVLLLAGLAVGLYAFSEEVGAAVPQVAPALERYVAAVDTARFWLDDMARSLAGERG